MELKISVRYLLLLVSYFRAAVSYSGTMYIFQFINSAITHQILHGGVNLVLCTCEVFSVFVDFVVGLPCCTSFDARNC